MSGVGLLVVGFLTGCALAAAHMIVEGRAYKRGFRDGALSVDGTSLTKCLRCEQAQRLGAPACTAHLPRKRKS